MDKESSGNVCMDTRNEDLPSDCPLQDGCLAVSSQANEGTGTAHDVSSLGEVSPTSIWHESFSEPLGSALFPLHHSFSPCLERSLFPALIKWARPFQERKFQPGMALRLNPTLGQKQPHLRASSSWLLRLYEESKSIMYLIKHLSQHMCYIYVSN